MQLRLSRLNAMRRAKALTICALTQRTPDHQPDQDLQRDRLRAVFFVLRTALPFRRSFVFATRREWQYSVVMHMSSNAHETSILSHGLGIPNLYYVRNAVTLFDEARANRDRAQLYRLD